jgi:3-deoxy-D-manno-octulosonic-acid transferase
LRARRGLVDRLVARARVVRDPARPLAWFHASSVGEGLQARPVVEALRAARPDVQVAYTFFSPSAERFAAGLGADLCDYLPFDRASHADALLDALQPSVLVFAKLDVWPVLVSRAAARGVPVALVSATLAARSGRRGWWSRQLLHGAYAALDAVAAIDAGHAERLVALGVRRAVVQVAGDTRFDQVAARAERADRASPMLAALHDDRVTLVAGSTWPADEAVLLPAWRDVHARDPSRSMRLVIAPHEPTPAHLAPIERWAAECGLTLRRLTAIEAQGAEASATGPDVVLVDRVGALGDLYALADAAFVGGGFHAAGLHSVIEPAAFGVPVLFGPGHDMSREAGLLLEAAGGRVARSSAELAAILTTWRDDRDARQRAGAAARALVERERGATERTLSVLLGLLGTEDRRR